MQLIIVQGTGDKSKERTVDVGADATVKDLKTAFYKLTKKNVHRQSYKKEVGDKVVRLEDDNKRLKEYGVSNGDKLVFKDLGPQIGYRTVFLLEYAGPIVFMLLYYIRPSIIFGPAAASVPYDWVASVGVICWIAHFLKREFETLFIHRFSRPTMPLSNLFKNCMYYWAFGAVIGYPLCHPGYKRPEQPQVFIGLTIFVVSEIGNFVCHVMLRNMRPAEGSTERKIPTGFLFDFVSCPNYTFEVLSWVGFSIMTQIFFSYAFTLVGFLQMADWAVKKHKNYLKSYEEYKGLRRKAIIPFVY